MGKLRINLGEKVVKYAFLQSKSAGFLICIKTIEDAVGMDAANRFGNGTANETKTDESYGEMFCIHS